MSTQEPDTNSRTDGQNSQQEELEQLLPLVSAADAGRSNRIRVRFDEHIADMLKHHARNRSLDSSKYGDRDFRNHLLGFASEVAVATWLNGSADTRVFDDFEGDGGVDVTAAAEWGSGVDRIQVKATRDIEDPERLIERNKISDIDYAVLACSDIPERYVEIVGYTSQKVLQLTDDVYGRNGPMLRNEILNPVSGRLYQPADVREVVSSTG